MAGKILIINRGSALRVKRLDAILKEETDIETVIVEPSSAQIEPEKDSADVFVLFTGDFVYTAQPFLVYLKNICFTTGKPLCVVGDEKEMTEVAGSIPRDRIAREFIRPFDVKDLAAALEVMLYAEDENISRGKQILLVDDDITFLQMVKSWLGAKYSVAVARSGMQAITYIAEHKADLILLDYDMPVMNGPQVLEALRSETNSANIPVIFLTGKNDRDSVMSVMRLKPDGYLLKSMNREDILASVDRFFKTKKWQNL